MSGAPAPGMGRPSGPEFTVPQQPGTSQPGTAAARPRIGPPSGPPPDRRPVVLTLLAVGLVTIVVAVASTLAVRDDVRLATPRPVVSQVPVPSTPRADRIEFTAAGGTGVLQIVDHAWDSDGTSLTEPGSLLTVVVELTCETGIVPYGPDAFQAFDRRGDLFDPEVVPEAPGALGIGTLSAGQTVRGTIAFDIPRGGVTLLMSDERSRTVTALRVPD